MWNRSRAKPGANFFVVLADNSQGMQIKDRSAAKTRGDELKELSVSAVRNVRIGFRLAAQLDLFIVHDEELAAM